MSFRSSCFLEGLRAFPAVLATVAIGILTSTASAVTIDGASILVGESAIATGSGGGRIGSYTYDAANDAYYVVLFGGTSGIRKITRTSTGSEWTATDYVKVDVSNAPSDLRRFYLSSDVAGGNVSTSDTTTNITPSSILLNPAPLTINVPAPANYNESFGYGPVTNGKISITYPAGSLAYISDAGGFVKQGGTNIRNDWTKRVYRWDLRSVGTPTTVQPDYNTGKSGDATNPNPDGLFGAYNQTDWNDTLASVVTEQALHNAYSSYQTLHPGAANWGASDTSNVGRQFAWSTDGQSLYVVSTATIAGGVYKVSATDGTANLIYSEPGASNIIAEPTVVPTSRRNFGAGFGAGDQIVFDGTAANGNEGGISYVVHNGTSTSDSKVLVSGQRFRDYAEFASGGSVTYTTSDSHGNIFFYENSTQSLHKLDTQGRLSIALNAAQLYELNETQGAGRVSGGGLNRLQVREDATGEHVTFRAGNKYIGAVAIYDTGDFNHDGNISQSDKDFFITQYNKTYHGNAPLVVGTNGATAANYVDYIKADINGSSKPTSSATTPKLSEASVTYKDLLVLDQFIEHETGDLNWDGTALDNTDRGIFNSHFNHAASEFGFTSFSWFDGDVTGDGLVDRKDYLRLTLPADLNFDGFVGIDDLTILQTYWGQNVLARNTALGDISEDGFVGIDDLTLLQTAWGHSVSVPSTGFALLPAGLTQAVPEPSVFVLLGMAALASVVWVGIRKDRPRVA